MGDFKINFTDLKFFRLRSHVEVISTTVTDLLDLPSYRGKYGKNVKKTRLSMVLMGLKNNFNLNKS